MSPDKEHLRVQYFYNSLIEFIYFTIVYIDSYGFIHLSTLSKYVQFFKVEVSELLSSFAGNTPEEKLCNMLNVVNCFVVSEDKIKARQTRHLKTSIFENLILSKTVDLALKGIRGVDDICKNLNFNDVISIDNKTLLNILKKSSHFLIERNCLVSLLHYHGILGFEGYSCNLVVCYFQNILQHGQTLSYNEIEYHGKFISCCGIYDMLPIFCILYCSDNFHCENGQIMLNQKSKKYRRQKPLPIKLRENISETAVPVGKIVYHAYGTYIQKWTGEICNLTESFGTIYCVTDFTNNHRGVFKVYFNKSALKFISEICSLKKHLQLRNVVEFDATYYHTKMEYCWYATRIKTLKVRFDYDELLLNTLKQKSELQRKHCADNKSCSSVINDSYQKCFHVSLNDTDTNSNKFKVKECELENPSPKKRKIDDNDFKSLNDKFYIENYTLPRQESSNGFSESISNFILPDYVFVFGHVFMLMADKGIAIGKQGNKLFNILFLKDSIYPPNKSQNFLFKDQKILALIPYIEEMDTVPVASFVYGLSEDEEKTNISNPKEFARIFLPSIFKDLTHKLNDSCCNIVNSLLTVQPYRFVDNFPQPEQLREFHELIIGQCNISPSKIGLVCFWKRMIRACSKKIFKDGATLCVTELSKDLRKKFALEDKLRIKQRKINRLRNILIVGSHLEKSESMDANKSNLSSLNSYKSCNFTNSSDTFYSCGSDQKSSSSKEVVKENGSLNNLNVESKYLSKSSLSSVSSYKSHDSTNSIDTFYSCDSDQNISSKEGFEENVSISNQTIKSKSMDASKNSLSSYKSSLSTDSTDTVQCHSVKNSPNEADFGQKLNSEENTQPVLDDDVVTPLPTVLNSKFSLVVENVDEVLREDTNKKNTRDQKCRKAKIDKYSYLQSFPLLKHISNKMKKQLKAPSFKGSACIDCYKSSCKITACISLITDTFFFYNVNVNGSSAVLPVPRRLIPEKLQEKMKLNSSSDIVIIPNTPINLSHILSISMIC